MKKAHASQVSQPLGGHIDTTDSSVGPLAAFLASRRELSEEGGFRHPGIRRNKVAPREPFKSRSVITALPVEVENTIDNFTGDEE